RYRVRVGPGVHAARRGGLDPRGHRVPEDTGRVRPADRRADAHHGTAAGRGGRGRQAEVFGCSGHVGCCGAGGALELTGRRLLVTGASGYLGSVLASRAVAAGWAVHGTFHSGPSTVDGVSWAPLDVTSSSDVTALFER